MPIFSGGDGSVAATITKDYRLTGGNITDTAKDIINLDNNAFYEIIYTSQNYGASTNESGWRYVRWHGFDGSGNTGENAEHNWHFVVAENTGTAESSDTPVLDVNGTKLRITYGNGYMSYRALRITVMAGDGNNRMEN